MVSIIVLNYNGAANLPDCLQSLVSQDYQPIEIILADNGSTDDSERVCKHYPEVRFVPLGRNYGFARGNNEGAKFATGKYLLFVSDDMRFPPDLVRTLVAVAETDELIFGLDVKQYNWAGTELVHSAFRMYPAVARDGGFLPYVDVRQVAVDAVTPIPWACASNLLCRRWMFEQLGGFDPTFFFECEDVDLGWRAWLRGWKSLHVPYAHTWHKIGGSAEGWESRAAWGRMRYYHGLRSGARFIWKTMDGRTILWRLVGYHRMALRSLVGGHFFGAVAPLVAWWSGILQLRSILRSRAEVRRTAVTNSRELVRYFLGLSGSAE
jgi:GT2 family glycosyltransferase